MQLTYIVFILTILAFFETFIFLRQINQCDELSFMSRPFKSITFINILLAAMTGIITFFDNDIGQMEKIVIFSTIIFVLLIFLRILMLEWRVKKCLDSTPDNA